MSSVQSLDSPRTTSQLSVNGKYSFTNLKLKSSMSTSLDFYAGFELTSSKFGNGLQPSADPTKPGTWMMEVGDRCGVLVFAMLAVSIVSSTDVRMILFFLPHEVTDFTNVNDVADKIVALSVQEFFASPDNTRYPPVSRDVVFRMAPVVKQCARMPAQRDATDKMLASAEPLPEVALESHGKQSQTTPGSVVSGVIAPVTNATKTPAPPKTAPLRIPSQAPITPLNLSVEATVDTIVRKAPAPLNTPLNPASQPERRQSTRCNIGVAPVRDTSAPTTTAATAVASTKKSPARKKNLPVKASPKSTPAKKTPLKAKVPVKRTPRVTQPTVAVVTVPTIDTTKQPLAVPRAGRTTAPKVTKVTKVTKVPETVDLLKDDADSAFKMSQDRLAQERLQLQADQRLFAQSVQLAQRDLDLRMKELDDRQRLAAAVTPAVVEVSARSTSPSETAAGNVAADASAQRVQTNFPSALLSTALVPAAAQNFYAPYGMLPPQMLAPQGVLFPPYGAYGALPYNPTQDVISQLQAVNKQSCRNTALMLLGQVATKE